MSAAILHPSTSRERTSPAAWYALATLSAVVWYAVIDRQVLILLGQSLKEDLFLSDMQLGSLHGLGLVLFSAVATLPLGWLADKVDRRMLLAACILIWSVAVATCGLAGGYGSLMVSVAFLAAGEASLTPIVYSLIPDLFPEHRRVTANFIYYAALMLGGGAGLAIAGLAIEHIDMIARQLPPSIFTQENWRLVFFVVAVPGPLLAGAIMLIKVRRSGVPGAAKAASAAMSELSTFLRVHWKAIAGVCVPLGLAQMGANSILLWLPIVLMRDFSLSAGPAGAGLGVAISIGSLAGLLIIGTSTKFLIGKWGDLTPVRVSQLGYLVFGLLTPLYLVTPSPTLIFVLAGVQMAAACASNALTPTVIQLMSPAPLRGRIFALSMVITTLFQVVGPILVGGLSDRLSDRAGGLLLASVAISTIALLTATGLLVFAKKAVVDAIDSMRGRPKT